MAVGTQPQETYQRNCLITSNWERSYSELCVIANNKMTSQNKKQWNKIEQIQGQRSLTFVWLLLNHFKFLSLHGSTQSSPFETTIRIPHYFLSSFYDIWFNIGFIMFFDDPFEEIFTRKGSVWQYGIERDGFTRYWALTLVIYSTIKVAWKEQCNILT